MTKEEKDEYLVDYKKKRAKGGFDGNSQDSLRAKEWLAKNHKQIEKQYGIPEGTLMMIAHHESRFDPYARSWSGAQGMFQFTGMTGKHYGLKIGNGVDERLDYRKAADAAAKYVSDEIKSRGNVALALAQWNGGGNAVKYAKEGKIKEYVSPNGTVGETHGFLRGLQKSAQELGFTHLHDEIENTVYKPFEDVELNKNSVIDTGTVPGQSSFKNAFDNQIKRRSEMKAHSARVPFLDSPKTLFQNPEQNELTEQKTPSRSVHSFAPFYQELAEKFRIYKSGGSLIQMSGDKIETVLKGEERIYSRGDTKRMMELAKKAKTKDDFFLLGKFFYDATKKQDSRDPEYVED